MAFNHDHINGNLWDKANSATLDSSSTSKTVSTIKALTLTKLVKFSKLFFGCDKDHVLLERELTGDQIYWEKRNMFFDVINPLI